MGKRGTLNSVECGSDFRLCRRCTRILVTNQLHFDPEADVIVMLERGTNDPDSDGRTGQLTIFIVGEIVETGTFSDLMQANRGFASTGGSIEKNV